MHKRLLITIIVCIIIFGITGIFVVKSYQNESNNLSQNQILATPTLTPLLTAIQTTSPTTNTSMDANLTPDMLISLLKIVQTFDSTIQWGTIDKKDNWYISYNGNNKVMTNGYSVTGKIVGKKFPFP